MAQIWCVLFLVGVFQSLQKGFTIEARDIDAAINNICEESLPLETNMTSFLHATCGHFQKIVAEAQLYREPESVGRERDFEVISKEVTTDAGAKDESEEHLGRVGGLPKKPSVRFMDFLDDSDG